MEARLGFVKLIDGSWDLVGFDGAIIGNFDTLQQAYQHAMMFFDRDDVRNARRS